MSAGVFEKGKYLDNTGNCYAVRVQPESKGLTLGAVGNSYPTDAIDPNLPTLAISQNRRGFGVKVRTVTVKLTADGTNETGDYLGEGAKLTVPVFDPAVYAQYGQGQTGTYLGIACEFSSKNPELIR